MANLNNDFAIKAEESVVDSILLNNDSILDVMALVPEDFLDQRLRSIFRCMLRLFDQHIAIDEITIKQAADDAGEQISISYIAELTERTPTAANAGHYANVVKSASLARSAASVIDAHGKRVGPVRDGIGNLTAELLELLGKADSGAQSMRALLRKWIEAQNRRYLGQKDFVPTGIEELDDALGGGLYKRELSILGARPSVGKTAFGLDIARRTARAGKKVLFFSLEMPAIDIMGRLIAVTSKIPFAKIRAAERLTPNEKSIIIEAAAAVNDLNLSINDSKCMTPMQMRASARSYASKNGIDLIVVDYLQKMTARDHRSTREQQVAEFAEGLKSMAVECDCPVLGLAQLNRTIDSRSNEEPILSDLRDSGRIEQEADVIMMLWRQREGNAPSSARGLSIAKCRNGEAGIRFDMDFACAHGEFSVERRVD